MQPSEYIITGKENGKIERIIYVTTVNGDTHRPDEWILIILDSTK